ncbi:HASI-like protein, partial [Leptotrombidium deliense]
MFFTSHGDVIKCSVVERFNRTLQSKIFKYFTANGTRRYIDVLQDLVNAFNNTYHRTIKMKPIQVTASNQTHSASKRSLIKYSPKLIQQNTIVRRKYERTTFDI